MFNWIKRLFGFQETLEEVRQEKDRRARRIVTPSTVSTVAHYGKQRSTHIPHTHAHALDEDARRRRQDDSDTSGFATGLILGSLLNSGSDSPSPSYTDPSPSFDGFSGGASGGGGADSSWDSAPSCDTSSFDSGSSSFDSGSSCSDFSGGGSSDFGS